MESMSSVAFAAVMVIGVGAATLGGIVLEHLLPTYFGKRADGKLEPPVQREVAGLRKELEASRREIDRLETIEDHLSRVQERVVFLERLLQGEPDPVGPRGRVQEGVHSGLLRSRGPVGCSGGFSDENRP